MPTRQAITVIGTVDPNSDGHIFTRKRLIVKDIKLYEADNTSPKGWSLQFQVGLQIARQAIIESLQEALPPLQAGLVLAVVFGTTEWLASDIEPYFEVTGTLHILAASGQNVALLLMMIEPIIPHYTPIKIKGGLLLLAVLSYLAIVGLQPSLVRATAMSVILIISRYILLCQYSPIYALAISIPMLLLFRPEWVIAIGFLLSICATLGIVVLYPLFMSFISGLATRSILVGKVKELFYSNTMSSYIIESSVAGIAAQIATAPILFTQIGKLQLLSFIPTTIVSWLVPVLMTYSLMVLTGSGISSFFPPFQYLADMIALLLVWLPTDLFLHLLQVLAHFEWGVIHNVWLE